MYACSLEISIILAFIQNLGSKKQFLWRKKNLNFFQISPAYGFIV